MPTSSVFLAPPAVVDRGDAAALRVVAALALAAAAVWAVAAVLSVLLPLVGQEQLAVGFELDIVPIMVGVAVLGLAAVFRVGSRLQRETDGLV